MPFLGAVVWVVPDGVCRVGSSLVFQLSCAAGHRASRRESWINRGVWISPRTLAGRKDFDAALCFNVPKIWPWISISPTLMSACTTACSPMTRACRRWKLSLEVAVDAQGTGELEFAGYIGSLVEKS